MRSQMQRAMAVVLGLGILTGLSACNRDGTAQAASVDVDATATRIMAFAKSGKEWPSRGGGYDEQQYSPLTQINKGNVGQLGLAWVSDVDSHRGLEATPIMVDGVLYVTSTWSRVMAFDAVSGKALWTYDPQVPRGIGRRLCCDIVNRGVAVSNGKVYVGTLDGRLVALDAATGKPVWTISTVTNPDEPYSITGAPRVIKGHVLIGNGGADRGVRGYVTAYDAQTGKEDWRFWVTPQGPDAKPENDDVAAALKSWPKEKWWEGQGGGTPWDAMAYDPDLNLLYVGTGNGGPWKRQHLDDKSDNLYVSSIVALNPDTGKLVWHYQETPGDRWDYTATNSLILADMKIDGKPRQVIFQAPKSGFFYVLDRKTGQLLSAEKYGVANWASHVDMATGRPVLTKNADFSKVDRLVYPNPNGAHDWQPMSFSPKTGLAYIPALDVPWVQSAKPGFRYLYDIGVPPAELARMTEGEPKVEKGGFLKAWDVANHKLKWKVALSTTWNSGTLSTAGDLVFQASGDGYFSAYNAETGDRLLHLFTGNSAMAAPITYAIGGTQYVAQLSGYGGSGMITVGDDAAVKRYENTGRLIVFRLNGDPVPTPAKREEPLGPPHIDASKFPPLSQAQIARGRQLYLNCAGCHSTRGGTPILPNLGRVQAIGKDAFQAILLDGVLVPNGMPKFADKLNKKDVETLYEYIIRGYHNEPLDHRWY